ncbi:hypothetical protein LTR53_019622, partial [Teratosphaeriaceae sp. CCFEE 6253]
MRAQSLTLNDRNDAMSFTSTGSRGRFSTFSDGGAAETHLYLPVKLGSDAPSAPAAPYSKSSKSQSAPDPALQDLQTLIDIRNFFSFLLGGPLVATERKGSWFQIFMSIAGILKTYDFTNADGSTFGDVAN